MNYSIYLISLVGMGAIFFAFAFGIFQDQVSRVTEGVFDSIEYRLALSRERRAARERERQRECNAAASHSQASSAYCKAV